MKAIATPLSERAVRALAAGDVVEISGRVYTGRDKLHKHFADGGRLPVDFRGGVLYHCGPVCVPDGACGWRVPFRTESHCRYEIVTLQPEA